MVKKKDSLLNQTPCRSCGSYDTMIYHGKRLLKNSVAVQLIKCCDCEKVMRLNIDSHLFSRQLKDREVLVNSIKDLSRGKSIRKTAASNGISPGTVVKTRNKTQEFIRKNSKKYPRKPA